VSTTPTASTTLSAAPPPAAPSATPSAATSSAAAIRVDPALLDVLPSEIDGQPLRPDDATAADIAGTGDLATDVEAIAVGLYIRASETAEDLAVASVVRLRSGVFDDGWYRSWRETYDQGACEVAGGVTSGAAEAEIGGHTTHIGSCVEAVHTYHVHLADPERVVSITAAGDGRFGERVVAGLTE
jgi:hypothetical protein